MFSPRQKVCSSSERPRGLSLSDCLAKTYLSKDGKKYAGREVFSHCQIVGEVARAILARMPHWLREELFPKGVELIAAAHDIGKISPTFQKKIYTALDKNLVELEKVNPDLEKNWGGHGGTGQVALSNNSKVGKYIPEIIGKHHGYPSNLGGKIATDDVLGGVEWQARREECLVQLQSAFNYFEWPKIKSYEQALAIAGLTTVADWIGSSSHFEDPNVLWQSYIQQALDNAGFVPPKLKTGLTFTDIFSYCKFPHNVQQKLYENIIGPGVYIMEAPMGVGKTEAALYAAYSAMCAGKATGIYFALPTQLTSDKIHERVNNFLRKILESRHEAFLLHSLAWLKKEIGEEGAPGGSWFEVGKRGILAPFAVGTIDQALMAVMNVKHGFVRTFGLAGKVVILDEVHSYDAYTGTILDQLVKALKELHCTIIILSATLTQERRKSLLSLENNVLVENSYPLITSCPKESSSQEIIVAPLQNNQITLNLLNEDAAVMDEALLRVEQGQQVLWIENTVDEAQHIYKILASKDIKNIEYGLLHSRFLKIDREKNEEYWVKLYGKDNNGARKQRGRILVGTQVLEQSLDIDADFLVTCFCPTDMLLQRLGRLWRHADTDTVRPKKAMREAWILAPKLSDAIDDYKRYFDKTANVYSPYVLIRSLEVWQDRPSIILPKDIRSLIEATYKERDETINTIGRLKYDLQTKREDMARFALNSISKGTQTVSDNKASTRYSEQDNVEVLLIRSYRHNEDKSGTYVMLLNGEEIYLPRNTKKLSKQEWREIAALLTRNTLHVVEYLAPNPISSKSLYWLKNYLYVGDEYHAESLLRVAIVEESGDLKALDKGRAATDCRLCYDAKLGYRAEKIS